MDRPDVIQGLLNLYSNPSYLEVGVNHGITFHAITAARKVAVDPKFNFDVPQARLRPGGATSDYHEVPSDDYFANRPAGDMFDVIFLDGLHTFDQTLRDLLNAMTCLKPTGAIVIDDVTPSSYAASLPTMEKMF